MHCAASCNSVHLCKQLVESGAAIFASTISDIETAADKCEEMEEGYIQCSQFLYGTWARRSAGRSWAREEPRAQRQVQPSVCRPVGVTLSLKLIPEPRLQTRVVRK